MGGSVVNIDDGLATRLGIADNPHWEPLDEADSHAGAATEAPVHDGDLTNLEVQSQAIQLAQIAAQAADAAASAQAQLAVAATADTDAPTPDDGREAADGEAKAPTTRASRYGRKASATESEGAKDASGRDQDN
ncbi:hypothetical protein R2360_13730 [Mycobacteroides chelonae]|nr:hypothetical protein [Mycobacteroides chelonae]